MSLGGTFESGQAYVALSRAKSLDSLRILGFNPKQVWANPDVLKFYKRISYHQHEFVALGQKKLSLPRSTMPLSELNKKQRPVKSKLAKPTHPLFKLGSKSNLQR